MLDREIAAHMHARAHRMGYARIKELTRRGLHPRKMPLVIKEIWPHGDNFALFQRKTGIVFKALAADNGASEVDHLAKGKRGAHTNVTAVAPCRHCRARSAIPRDYRAHLSDE